MKKLLNYTLWGLAIIACLAVAGLPKPAWNSPKIRTEFTQNTPNIGASTLLYYPVL